MLALLKRITPFLAVFLALTFMTTVMVVDHADARSKSGGRMFSRPQLPLGPQIIPEPTVQ